MSRVGAVAALALVLSATIVALCAPPAVAHTPHDEIFSVAASPDFAEDDTVYTISRRYPMKSTDRGDTWTRLVNGLDNRAQPSAIAVAPSDAEVLYLTVWGDGVYRSGDAGVSWSLANGDMGRQSLAFVEVSPHDADVVFVAGVRAEDGGWLTTDGGASWKPIADYGAIAAADFAHDDPQVLTLAAKDGVVHVSDDLGQAWSSTDLDLDGVDEIKTVLVDASFSDSQTIHAGTMMSGIWTSTDGGASFRQDSDGPSDPNIVDLVQTGRDLDEPTLWASTSDDGVFRSTDAGATWESDVDGLTKDEMADRIEHPNFGQLAPGEADAVEEPTMFMASFDGLFRSDSRADGWVNLATQVSNIVTGVSLSPDYVNDSTVALATYINGARLSTDGGDTWEDISDGLAMEFDWKRREDYVLRLMGISMYPTFPEDQMLQVGIRGYYAESTDGGAQWDTYLPDGILQADEFPPDYYVLAFSPDFDEDRTIVMGTDGGKVFRYTGDPESIELIAELGVEITTLQLSPDFAEDRTVLAGTKTGAAMSEDGGSTWTQTPLGTSARLEATSLAVSPDFASDGTAFIGTSIGLRVSRDHGATWQALNDAALGARPSIEAVVISPPVDGKSTMLVSVRGRGLFRSTDGGESFTAIAPELLEGQVVFNSWYHPVSEPIVFSPTFAEDQTVFGIAEEFVYRSTDGGDSWEQLDVPVLIHDVGVDPDQEYLPSTRGAVAAVSRERVPNAGGDASFDTPIGRLSPKRVAASVSAGLVVFGLLSLPLRRAALGIEAEEPGPPDARMAIVPNLALRVVLGAGTIAGALLALAA